MLSGFPQPSIVPVSSGESSTVVSPYLPGGVSDGQWHTLQLRYYNKVCVLQLSTALMALSCHRCVALALLFSGLPVLWPCPMVGALERR